MGGWADGGYFQRMSVCHSRVPLACKHSNARGFVLARKLSDPLFVFLVERHANELGRPLPGARDTWRPQEWSSWAQVGLNSEGCCTFEAQLSEI